MRQRIRTFKITCDRCRETTAIVQSRWRDGELPEGWDTEDVHDCGMTGYTRSDDLCPKCLEKIGGQKKLRT